MATKKDTKEDVTPAPVQVPDAGAVFQRDRSGSPRGREITEGAANFAAFSEQIRADAAKGAE